jgi:hypothetical protein
VAVLDHEHHQGSESDPGNIGPESAQYRNSAPRHALEACNATPHVLGFTGLIDLRDQRATLYIQALYLETEGDLRRAPQ